jgi:hypothetical protein
MLTKRRSLSIAVTGALLFLSLAVFGLGLHNKLSLYKVNRHVHYRIVKLSVRQRSVMSLLPREQGREGDQRISSPELVWTSLLLQGNVCHFSRPRLAELKLCRPGRCSSLGPNLLPLPPPTHS